MIETSITDFFMQFGALGIVAWNMFHFQKKTDTLIKNNTDALSKFVEVTRECHKRL